MGIVIDIIQLNRLSLCMLLPWEELLEQLRMRMAELRKTAKRGGLDAPVTSQQPSQGTFTIVIEDTAESFSCLEYESILRAMERLNHKGIPIGCRGGGCGVCKIQVTAGCYRTGRLSREHVSPEEEAAGITLACRTEPDTDLSLRVLGTMRDTILRGGVRAADPGVLNI